MYTIIKQIYFQLSGTLTNVDLKMKKSLHEIALIVFDLRHIEKNTNVAYLIIKN